MVALNDTAERQLRDIALIQEGLAQSHAGLGAPIADVVARFKMDGLLPEHFMLDADEGQASG